MASMKLKEQLDEQPKKEKPIIGNFQEPSENVGTNEAILAKTAEGMDKGNSESTNLPFSRPHRKLPAELNREIFYCFNLATRRKFIYGLGWNFYAMFRQILLKKSNRLRNPQGNAWRSNAKIIISNGGLNASKNTYGWQDICAEKGFPVSGANCRMDDFPGTICYYYEVKILNSSPLYKFTFGYTNGRIPLGELAAFSPNSYYIGILIPNGYFYLICLSGQGHEFPEVVIRPEPELKGTGNVVGCGILMDPDDKLTIFFTLNGIFIDRQFPIDPRVNHLIPIPTVSLCCDMSLEANFGDNPAKPFEYDIKHCPGMGLEWI